MTDRQVEILHIDDEPMHRERVATRLVAAYGNAVSIAALESERVFMEYLANAQAGIPGIVIMDGRFPFDYLRRDPIPTPQEVASEGPGLAGLRCLRKLVDDPRFAKTDLVLFTSSSLGDVRERAEGKTGYLELLPPSLSLNGSTRVTYGAKDGTQGMDVIFDLVNRRLGR